MKIKQLGGTRESHAHWTGSMNTGGASNGSGFSTGEGNAIAQSPSGSGRYAFSGVGNQAGRGEGRGTPLYH